MPRVEKILDALEGLTPDQALGLIRGVEGMLMLSTPAVPLAPVPLHQFESCEPSYVPPLGALSDEDLKALGAK